MGIILIKLFCNWCFESEYSGKKILWNVYVNNSSYLKFMFIFGWNIIWLLYMEIDKKV